MEVVKYHCGRSSVDRIINFLSLDDLTSWIARVCPKAEHVLAGRLSGFQHNFNVLALDHESQSRAKLTLPFGRKVKLHPSVIAIFEMASQCPLANVAGKRRCNRSQEKRLSPVSRISPRIFSS